MVVRQGMKVMGIAAALWLMRARLVMRRWSEKGRRDRWLGGSRSERGEDWKEDKLDL